MHVIAYYVVGAIRRRDARQADADRDHGDAVDVVAADDFAGHEVDDAAFSACSDLDLILASPVAAHQLFAVRISTVALSVATMALPLAVPFIDMMIVAWRLRWLGAYGVIVAMGATATALAVALRSRCSRIGPKRTRLVAQIVAAVIGAAFVISLQVAAILSYGTLSRGDVLRSDAVAGGDAGRRSVVGGRPGRRSGWRCARRRGGFQPHPPRRDRRDRVAALR